jgi:hypothetical protein
MSSTYGAVTELTVKWSDKSEEGVIPGALRKRLLEAAKGGDILVLDLITDAIHELKKLYAEAGYDPDGR